MMRRLWNVQECSTFLFWIEGGGGSVEQEWGRTNIPEIEKSRMALGTAWVHLRPPDPPSFGVLSFLVKNPRAVSEATTKEGRRARVRRCVQISEEFFSVK